MKTFWTSILMGSLMMSSLAWGNPVSSEIVRARQVPKTLHVQFTYGTHDAALPTITKLTRDGNAASGTWTTLDAFRTNTGSGLASVKGTQFCDCNVPQGEHAYKLEYKAGDKANTLEVNLTVVENLPEPTKLDAGTAATDMMSWDIPDPIAIQGVDCLKACTITVVKDSGTMNKDSGATVDTGSTAKAATDDSGCSFTGAPHATGLALLLGLSLLLVVRRRCR